MRLLVAGGATVAPVLPDGSSLVERARARGRDAVAATLVAAMARPPPAVPADALLVAATSGDANAAALAVRAGAGLEVRDSRSAPRCCWP